MINKLNIHPNLRPQINDALHTVYPVWNSVKLAVTHQTRFKGLVDDNLKDDQFRFLVDDNSKVDQFRFLVDDNSKDDQFRFLVDDNSKFDQFRFLVDDNSKFDQFRFLVDDNSKFDQFRFLVKITKVNQLTLQHPRPFWISRRLFKK